MPEPVIVPRADHTISRRDIDPEALKVLYRLREHQHVAYLVGGSVRDLLLGRRPKDFDVGTDAHPYQIKKLFRNCWIIGRRFRLAHIKFGPKIIEVATFRKTGGEALTSPESSDGNAPPVVASAPETPADATPIHRDNTFGTPEEDAFRRDFTINGLFYDIKTFSVIDYVGGLADLDRRLIRSIGDPFVRFVEDPVRMLRAAVLSARLGFDLDTSVIEAIAAHSDLIRTASSARLLEEYYKILRSGAAEPTFRALGRLGLLERITPELKSPPDTLWDSLVLLDQYRQRFATPPAALTNTLLIGALLQPLGSVRRGPRSAAEPKEQDRVSFGVLPVARRDLDRLRHALELVPRLLEPALPPRVARSLAHRPSFGDALNWLEVFHDAQAVVTEWKAIRTERGTPGGEDAESHRDAPASPDEAAPGTNRRRRRRRRRRGKKRTTNPAS